LTKSGEHHLLCAPDEINEACGRFRERGKEGSLPDAWMNRSTANMEAFARRLIAYEANGNKRSGTSAPAAFGRVVEKLRQPLVALTGVNGFRSLLSRALARAGDEFRWLRSVHVRADGFLECPGEMAQLDKGEIANGEAVLIARLLGLLVIFIGEALTLRLLHDVWPGKYLDDFDLSTNNSE